MHCIALVADLMFSSRVSGTARQAGATCTIVRDAKGMKSAVTSNPPSVVLVDMDADSAEAQDAIRVAKSACPDARVIAFFSHVRADLKEQASLAGADDVWPRSVFVEALPDILGRVANPGDGRPT